MLATKLTIGIPAFHKSVPVHTVAGNIVERIYIDSKMITRYSLDTDNTIYLGSATSASTSGEGGGKTVIECGKNFIYSGLKRKVVSYGGDFCQHENLLKGSAAQGAIVYQIMQAANRLKMSAPPPVMQNSGQVNQLSFVYSNKLRSNKGRLKDTVSDQWLFDDMAVWWIYPDSPARNEHGYFHVVYRDEWVNNPNPVLDQGSTHIGSVSSLKGETPVKTIGGKIPSKSGYLYANGTSKEYVWYFADKGMAVVASGDYATGFAKSGAYETIMTMTWR